MYFLLQLLCHYFSCLTLWLSRLEIRGRKVVLNYADYQRIQTSTLYSAQHFLGILLINWRSNIQPICQYYCHCWILISYKWIKFYDDVLAVVLSTEPTCNTLCFSFHSPSVLSLWTQHLRNNHEFQKSLTKQLPNANTSAKWDLPSWFSVFVFKWRLPKYFSLLHLC